MACIEVAIQGALCYFENAYFARVARLAGTFNTMSQPRSEAQNAACTSALPVASGGHPDVDWEAQVEYVRGLAAIVREENLGEIILQQEGVRVHLRSRRAAASTIASTNFASEFTAAQAAYDDEQVHGVEQAESPTVASSTPIVSPMVGLYYRAKSPDDPPFVEVGERIEIGQIVGLVEAMKTFNEITSEVEGEVVSMPVENGQLVQTGDPLILVAT